MIPRSFSEGVERTKVRGSTIMLFSVDKIIELWYNFTVVIFVMRRSR